jgi:hypothetical protein
MHTESRTQYRQRVAALFQVSHLAFLLFPALKSLVRPPPFQECFIVKGKKFYQTKRVLAPIPNERGPVTHDYIISVDTHDSHGNRYNDPEERAREAFNAAFGKTPVNLSEIDEKDVPKKERLEGKISLQGRAVYLIKND